MNLYKVGDDVKITDGFAHIGGEAKITKVWSIGTICYGLDKFTGWWQHSQLLKKGPQAIETTAQAQADKEDL